MRKHAEKSCLPQRCIWKKIVCRDHLCYARFGGKKLASAQSMVEKNFLPPRNHDTPPGKNNGPSLRVQIFLTLVRFREGEGKRNDAKKWGILRKWQRLLLLLFPLIFLKWLILFGVGSPRTVAFGTSNGRQCIMPSDEVLYSLIWTDLYIHGRLCRSECP